MPVFRVKDLSVHVERQIPTVQTTIQTQTVTPTLCRWPTIQCTAFTCGWGTRQPTCGGFTRIPTCWVSFTDCGRSFTTWPTDPTTPIINEGVTPQVQPVAQAGESLESLAQLREELQTQLAALDEAEAQMRKAAEPASLEEAEAVEAELKAALEEVQAMKNRFK